MRSSRRFAIGLEAWSHTSGQTRPGLALMASSASKFASLASNFVPAYLLNSRSERCDDAFQSPSADAARQPTRRSSDCISFAVSCGGYRWAAMKSALGPRPSVGRRPAPFSRPPVWQRSAAAFSLAILSASAFSAACLSASALATAASASFLRCSAAAALASSICLAFSAASRASSAALAAAAAFSCSAFLARSAASRPFSSSACRAFRGRSCACLLGRDLLQLRLGEAGIEPVRDKLSRKASHASRLPACSASS